MKTPSDDRQEVVARLNGAPEVGRRDIGSLSLRELHLGAINAHRRGRFSIGVNDDIFDRPDVNLRPGVGW